MSCQTCHKQGKAAFGKNFAKPYPHSVGMVKSKFGVAQVKLDEMIQFCIIEPMAGKPLAWDSKELAALTAYTQKLQNEFLGLFSGIQISRNLLLNVTLL
ncbi:MAG: hypothetical protein IMF12_07230 [Proteobacteria bacterium]|nr:hypothetical protein [Pseudomonadota bacterium]